MVFLSNFVVSTLLGCTEKRVRKQRFIPTSNEIGERLLTDIELFRQLGKRDLPRGLKVSSLKGQQQGIPLFFGKRTIDEMITSFGERVHVTESILNIVLTTVIMERSEICLRRKENLKFPRMGVIAVGTPDNGLCSRESFKEFSFRGIPIQEIETAVVYLFYRYQFQNLLVSTNALLELIEIRIPGPEQRDSICSNRDDPLKFDLGLCPCGE